MFPFIIWAWQRGGSWPRLPVSPSRRYALIHTIHCLGENILCRSPCIRPRAPGFVAVLQEVAAVSIRRACRTSARSACGVRPHLEFVHLQQCMQDFTSGVFRNRISSERASERLGDPYASFGLIVVVALARLTLHFGVFDSLAMMWVYVRVYVSGGRVQLE